MKVAVTGANGYIGSHVVNELLKRGHTVIATDMADNNINKQATVVLANIFETSDVFRLLGCPDAVIHMAWRNGFNHNNDSHIIDLPKHWAFTKQIIDAGCKSLTVMGTMHEIGYHIGEINENTPCNPMSLYGISKNSLRQMLLTYSAGKDISLKWLRAFYVTGDDTKNKSIFSKILEMAAAGQKTFPFTKGENQYDFTDINIWEPFFIYTDDEFKQDDIFCYPIVNDNNKIILTMSIINTNHGWQYSISSEFVDKLLVVLKR